MKKLIVSTLLLAGVSFGFAKSTPLDHKGLKNSDVTFEESFIERPVLSDGIRCVRYKSETFDAEGNSITSTTIQYCYETSTVLIDAGTITPPKLN